MQTGASSIPCCSKAAGSIRRHCRSLSRSLLAGEILGLVLVEVTAEPEPHKISGAKHRAVVCRGAGDSQGCIFGGIQLGVVGMPDFQRPCSPGNKIKSFWGFFVEKLLCTTQMLPCRAQDDACTPTTQMHSVRHKSSQSLHLERVKGGSVGSAGCPGTPTTRGCAEPGQCLGTSIVFFPLPSISPITAGKYKPERLTLSSPSFLNSE